MACVLVCRAAIMIKTFEQMSQMSQTSQMHNPAHPGEVLREWIPPGMSVTQAAEALKINRVTLSNLLNGRGNVKQEKKR
jgi:hypothetical protein